MSEQENGITDEFKELSKAFIKAKKAIVSSYRSKKASKNWSEKHFFRIEVQEELANHDLLLTYLINEKEEDGKEPKIMVTPVILHESGATFYFGSKSRSKEEIDSIFMLSRNIFGL